MANYSLVIDSKFKPYSFDELVKPYMMYGQAYNEQQNQLSDLSVKSNVWKGLINQQTERDSYDRFKKYSDDLENKASILAKEGLTPASRKGILDLNSRYSSEITPIENAWKARDEQRKVQEQMLAQDNTLLFSRHASTTSLDDYLKNPELSYTPYSGKLATAKSAQIAGTLAKELKSYGSGKPIDAFTNTFMKNYGLSSSDVFNAINNPKDQHSSKVLNAIVEQVVASSGVANWNDKEALDSVYSAAREGLWSAVGTTEVNPMENFGARASFQSNLEEGRQIRAENRAAARLNQPPTVQDIAINPLPIYSPKEKKQQATNVANFKQFFHRDATGKMKMTPAGLAEYRRQVYTKTGKPMVTPEGTTILTNVSWKQSASPFKRFMDSIGAKKFVGNKTDKTHLDYQPGNLGSIFSRYSKGNTADGTKATEYDFPLSSAQSDILKTAILTAGRGTDLQEVDFNGKNFAPIGKSIPVNAINAKEAVVTATRMSPYGGEDMLYGNTFMLKDAKGNVHRYALPPGINKTNEDNRNRELRVVLKQQQLIHTGRFKNGKLASPAELQDAENDYKMHLEKAQLFHSQLGAVNDVKPQTLNVYSN